MSVLIISRCSVCSVTHGWCAVGLDFTKRRHRLGRTILTCSSHLRGNVQGYLHAGSKLKYLRFITGRHDLPFYYDEEVDLQLSFLDAWLKGMICAALPVILDLGLTCTLVPVGDDRVGWSVEGKLAPVDIVLRRGDVGFNDAEAERAYTRRTEKEWPIARTQYTRFYLAPDLLMSQQESSNTKRKTVSYKALGLLEDPQLVQFTTKPFDVETEITGHIVAHLCVSVSKLSAEQVESPSDIDLFLTLRHISPAGNEVFYTGTAGDPVPLTKGWLRVSLRKVDEQRSTAWLPHRDYRSTDVQQVQPDTVYEVDVEVWPTNVIVEEGGKLVLEVSSGDTQGCGIFGHKHPEDRSEKVFAGLNHLHFGDGHQNYVVLPVIPTR